MSRKVVAALSLVALFSLSSAFASSITNRDDRDYKVVIVEGTATKDHILEPSGALQEVCKRGCVVRLNESNEEYELKGSDVVAIEDGSLYYAAAPGGSATLDTDDAVKPFKPGDR